MFEKLGTAANHIQSIKKISPRVGIILGSGLGKFVDAIENSTIIPYSQIPFFKETTVEGHEGRLILGNVGDIPIVVLQGRLHSYEGLPMNEVVFPVRVLATLGVETLILTNAAGGINSNYNSGDLVLIEDHINLTGKNPLIGPNINELGPRFPDMSYAYSPDLQEKAKETAKEHSINLKSGVYAQMLGPTYETPAEVKMLRILGADMVGMSTVPEAIAANHLGLNVLGISCITNMAAGMTKNRLNHDEVKEQALKVMNSFVTLLQEIIKKI